MCGEPTILYRLLGRGDQIQILDGRLVINPASGLPVPELWLSDHKIGLVSELLALVNGDGFQYISHSTGRYGASKCEGLTLQFKSILTGREFYCVFNVSLKRDRTTRYGKKGEPLPKGKFRVGRRSALYSFWLMTGLEFPRKLGEFSDSIGGLKSIIFAINSQSNDRVQKDKISLLSIDLSQVNRAYLGCDIPANVPPTSRQSPANVPPRHPAKELPKAHELQGIEPVSTTCPIDYGNKVISKCGNKEAFIDPFEYIKDQSVEEWLSDYDS